MLRYIGKFRIHPILSQSLDLNSALDIHLLPFQAPSSFSLCLSFAFYSSDNIDKARTMPATRSTVIAVPQQITFMSPTGPEQQQSLGSMDTKRPLNRVVASQEQLAILRTLHKTSFSRALTRDVIEGTAKETGLYEPLCSCLPIAHSHRTQGCKMDQKMVNPPEPSAQEGQSRRHWILRR